MNTSKATAALLAILELDKSQIAAGKFRDAFDFLEELEAEDRKIHARKDWSRTELRLSRQSVLGGIQKQKKRRR